MNNPIFRDFFITKNPRKMWTFFLISSFFHAVLIGVVLSGFFTTLEANLSLNKKKNLTNFNIYTDSPNIKMQNRKLNVQMNQNKLHRKKGRKRTNKQSFNIIPNRIGEIQGSVQDKSKNVIAGATIIAIHLDSRKVRSTIADTEGKYVFKYLQSGNYEIRVRTIRFKDVLRKRVFLKGDVPYRLNFEAKNQLSAKGSINVGASKKDFKVKEKEGVSAKIFNQLFTGRRYDNVKLFKKGKDWLLKHWRNYSADVSLIRPVLPGKNVQYFELNDHTIMILNSIYYLYKIINKTFIIADELFQHLLSR